MNNSIDFEIINGKLQRYIGTSASVDVPNNVTAIADGTFANRDIVEVTLPEGLLSIGKRAFLGCSKLEKAEMLYRSVR